MHARLACASVLTPLSCVDDRRGEAATNPGTCLSGNDGNLAIRRRRVVSVLVGGGPGVCSNMDLSVGHGWTAAG